MNMTQAERRKIIGASEVGAILGYSKYDSPYDIWMQKTRGKYLERSEAVKIAAEHGHQVEPWLLDKYEAKTGDKVVRGAKYLHDSNDYMIAHPDGVVPGYNGNSDGLVEIKTASAYLSDDWDVDESSDNIPVCYLAQVQQQMSVSDTRWTDVVVLIGNTDIRYYRIYRNHKMIEAMTKRLKHFWEYNVLQDIPPDASTMRDIQSRWDRVRKKSRMATCEEVELVIQIKLMRFDRLAHQKSARVIKEKEDKLIVKLANQMGDAEGLTLVNDKFLVTREQYKSGRRFNFFDRSKNDQ